MEIQKIKNFLVTESSSDALRNILSILIPGFILYYFTYLDFAIAFSTGILMACMTDLPGNKRDKLKTIRWSIPLFAITAFSISFALTSHTWIIVGLLTLFGFVYTMISIFGFRVSIVGNISLIVASFTIGLRPNDPLEFSLALILGTITYHIISLLQVFIYPYRSLSYAVDEAIEKMAELIRLKISCYDENASLSKSYKELSLLHIKVSDQLEAVRSLLLREKSLLKSDNIDTQKWLSKLYHLVDLYELLMANDTDYETVRNTFKGTETLPLVRIALTILSDETQKIQFSNPDETFSKPKREEINALINQLNKIDGDTNQVNLTRTITSHIEQVANILNLIKSDEIVEDNTWVESKNYLDFVPPKTTFRNLVKNLNFKSPIFVYALRMAILIGIAGSFSYLLPHFKYASWIILTIVLVARPTFFTTQKRNYQRIVGSLVGLAISYIIIDNFNDPKLLFAISALGLYLFLLFNKPNYLVCVIFITISIVIGQNLYNGDTISIFSSRLIFTLAGAVLAIIGTLAIPINHYQTIEKTTESLINNFKNYLQKITDNAHREDVNFYDLRLLRKFTQTSLAQSYDSLEQLLKEPIIGKQFKEQINHLQSLAYRINAMLLGLSVNITKSNGENQIYLLNERIQNINSLINESEELSKKIARKKRDQ